MSPFLANCARFICIEIDILMFEGALIGTGKVWTVIEDEQLWYPLKMQKGYLHVHFSQFEQHRTDFSIIKGIISIGMKYNQQ